MKSFVVLAILGATTAFPFHRPKHHPGTGHPSFPTGFPSSLPSGFPTNFPTGLPTGFPSGTGFPFPTGSFPALPSGTDDGLMSILPIMPTAEPIEKRTLEINYNLAPRQVDEESSATKPTRTRHHHHHGTGRPSGTGFPFGSGFPFPTGTGRPAPSFPIQGVPTPTPIIDNFGPK